MEKENSCCHHKHKKLLIFLFVVTFVGLAVGEFYLFRKQMKLTEMLSEGLMQLKEAKKVIITTTPVGSK